MIELKIDDFRDGNVTFHISRQDKEDYDRLECGSFRLTLSDGKEYRLLSSCGPCYLNGEENCFFVRGWDMARDNQKTIVEFTEFLKIFELVKAYNEIS